MFSLIKTSIEKCFFSMRTFIFCVWWAKSGVEKEGTEPFWHLRTLWLYFSISLIVTKYPGSRMTQTAFSVLLRKVTLDIGLAMVFIRLGFNITIHPIGPTENATIVGLKSNRVSGERQHTVLEWCKPYRVVHSLLGFGLYPAGTVWCVGWHVKLDYARHGTHHSFYKLAFQSMGLTKLRA